MSRFHVVPAVIDCITFWRILCASFVNASELGFSFCVKNGMAGYGFHGN